MCLSSILTFADPSPRVTTTFSDTQDATELAHRAIKDPDAFTELYYRFMPGIYRYHLARTGHIQEAEDLTAQTFLTALESITTFRGHGSFSSWLLGIASHKLADHFRRHRNELPLEAVEELHSPVPLPEDTTDQHLELSRVVRALRHITPERAEALVMCIFGGLSLAEAAQVMGKSKAAMKMLLYRGLSNLQERLAAHLEVA